MPRASLPLLLAMFSSLSCRPDAPSTAAVRASIDAELQRGAEATRLKDIEAYMSLLPPDFVIHDESGVDITREQQRAYALRDWSIIERTLDIVVHIDSLQVRGDSAIVFTSQRWERLMYRRDGVTLDTVLTTQRHREVWRRADGQWRNYQVGELGGSVHINGEPYVPPG